MKKGGAPGSGGLKQKTIASFFAAKPKGTPQAPSTSKGEAEVPRHAYMSVQDALVMALLALRG